MESEVFRKMKHNGPQVKNVRLSLAVCLWLSVAFSGQPDVLEIATGERYEGNLVNIRSGTLSFRTTLAGRIFVPVSEVKRLSTANFMAVTVDDTRLLPGRIDTRDGSFYVITRNDPAPVPIDLARITQVDTLPETPPEASEPSNSSPDEFRLSVETGYRVRLGSVDTSGPYARFETEGQTDRIRYEAQLDTEYTTDESSFDRFYHARGMLGGVSSDIAPQAFFDTRRDTNRALSNRTEFVGGAEGAVIDDEEQSLRAFAGLGVTFSDWEPSRIRSDQGDAPTSETSREREDLNLHLQLRYSRYIFDETRLTERLIVSPSLTNGGDFRAALESELSVPLALRLRLQFGVLLDFDNSAPYPDIDEFSAAVHAGIRFEF